MRQLFCITARLLLGRCHHAYKNHKPASVTIVAKDGKLCDALSTSLFVMGTDGAIEYWREHPTFEMILITQDHQVLVTEGLEGQFTLEEGHADLSMEVVK